MYWGFSTNVLFLSVVAILFNINFGESIEQLKYRLREMQVMNALREAKFLQSLPIDVQFLLHMNRSAPNSSSNVKVNAQSQNEESDLEETKEVVSDKAEVDSLDQSFADQQTHIDDKGSLDNCNSSYEELRDGCKVEEICCCECCE